MSFRTSTDGVNFNITIIINLQTSLMTEDKSDYRIPILNDYHNNQFCIITRIIANNLVNATYTFKNNITVHGVMYMHADWKFG